jgi:hypothetical protein
MEREMTRFPHPTAETNIRNLPEGTYWTEIGYSQSYPWVEVKRTAQTRTLAKVIVKKADDWKPEILPGGFCGHCTNQSEQFWEFDRIDHTKTVTISATKKGWSRHGTKFIENRAVEFYDWNF